MVVPSDNPLRAVLLLVLVGLELGFVAWYRKYRGTWPRGKAPAEISRVMLAFVVGAVVVVGGLALVLWLTTPWVAALVALVVVTVAVARYERAYADAAARARARLG
jgi:CHASE2 domain-containing sensor protein